MTRNGEIREILMGHYDPSADRISYEKDNAKVAFAMSMAIVATGIFGPVRYRKKYTCLEMPFTVMMNCRNAFADQGRYVSLESEPELLAIYTKPWWAEPTVLTAELNEASMELVLTGHARRSFFSAFEVRAIVKKIAKSIDGIQIKTRKEAKAEKKEERRLRKERVRQLRQERRAQKAQAGKPASENPGTSENPANVEIPAGAENQVNTSNQGE